jgi:hypothetical protein
MVCGKRSEKGGNMLRRSFQSRPVFPDMPTQAQRKQLKRYKKKKHQISQGKHPIIHPPSFLLSSSLHSPTICINSTFSPSTPEVTFAHTANGILTLLPKSPLSHCTCPKTATSSPLAKEVSASKSKPWRCSRMELKVSAMALGPVWATEECRRVDLADSGMFLGFVRVLFGGWGGGWVFGVRRNEPVRT